MFPFWPTLPNIPRGPPIELSILLTDEVIELIEFLMAVIAPLTEPRLVLKVAAFDLALVIKSEIVFRTV